MTRLENLEKLISDLSAKELADFRAWFAAFDSENWDREIAADEASGKLDELAEQALADHRAGRTTPL